MPGSIYFIIMLLPYVAVCALIGGFIGWYLRCKIGKCHGHTEQAVAAPTQTKPSADDAARTKKLQEKLKQADALNATLKQDLDSLKSKSVSKSEMEVSQGKIFAATAELAQEKQRMVAVTADLKKAQETISGLNAKLNVDVKEQKDRTFSLENELSQAREQLQRYQSSTDDSADLRSELERAREMAANATRFAGESRKREASLTDEIESLKAKLAKQAEVSATAAVIAGSAFAASIPAKPAGDSEAVLKAKAEVERLNAEKALAEKETALKEAAIREQAIRVAAEKAALAKAEAERITAEKEAAEREWQDQLDGGKEVS
jgi:chromosome segregation ATPase